MGLRLAEGVDVGRIAQLYGVEAVDWTAVDRLVASGHLMRDGEHIALTGSGRLLLDHILGLIAAPTRAWAVRPELPAPAPRRAWAARPWPVRSSRAMKR